VETSAPTADPGYWRDQVSRLEAREHLTSDELAGLVRAHWWLGEVTACLERGEQLFERLVDEGRPGEAADTGLRLALVWATRGDVPIALGWLSRSERLLERLPRGPVHGVATYLRVTTQLELEADPTEATAAADELDALAREHRERSLECFAVTLRGMSTVMQGDLDGFRDLDEAMTMIVGGRVDPMWAGDIYCSVIHLCEGLGDLGRMRAWTDALESWAAPLSSTFVFAGVTRVHQLQLLRAEGDWDAVERELGTWSDRLVGGHGWLAGVGFYELGDLHRMRGRLDQARACFARARALGIEPQPGEARLLHAEGQGDQALDTLRAALAGQPPLTRARMLGAAAELALALGDRSFAETATRDLEDVAACFGTPGLLADAAVARAECLVADGSPVEALRLLDRAARTYREQRHQYALARVHEVLAEAHAAAGDPQRAAASAATARAIHQRLGAVADLARPRRASTPAGLTQRELQVLAQVSAGLTNREVAAALSISGKTVSRHLESIFAKAGVTTRTAAAAWARTHDLG